MSVGIKVKYYWFQVGSASFFYSFFSTIAVNLEEKQWGSLYPKIMNDFYQGHLLYKDVKTALEELNLIERGLRRMPTSRVIWDFDDLSKRPPWGDNISPSITNLADYFVTSDGERLFTVLVHALEKAQDLKENVKIENL